MKNNINNHKKLSTIIGLIVGIILLYVFLPNKNVKLNLEDFALDENTKTYRASIENKKIHCSDLKDISSCIKGYKAENKNYPVVVWLGNSQLHAINQYKKGDNTAALHIHKYLKGLNFYSLTFSQPNANLQEHYLLFAYLLDQFKISTLILPIVFDDLREDQIRSNIISILNYQNSFKRIEKSLSGKRIISKNNQKDLAGNEINIIEDTIQNNFENFIDDKLGNIWPLWMQRDSLIGQLYGNLYLLRNSIFGIKATTTRKIIKGRYANNINALMDILSLAIENEVNVIVYIPPIRNDIKIPYNISQYINFKHEINEITKHYETNFANLENLIPAKYWGKKASTSLKKEEEVDFMHFQAEGHNLLAKAIFLEFKKILKLSE